MKVIIFGLGSMGKRRARCLQIMGYSELFGFDISESRVNEAKLLGVQSHSELSALPLSEADAYFICTPPDKHENYIRLAIEYLKPCFVEASVVLNNLEEIEKQNKITNILIAPSCTMQFHPAIKIIKNLILSNKYGNVTNFSYHCGQYLPDWHPWEDVKNYYVSNPLTGGCREIVPFELTWIADCLGFPEKVMAYHGATMDVGAHIADTYAISLKFASSFGVMLIDVTSRYAVRHLILNFENAQIQWRWDVNSLQLYDAVEKNWQTIAFERKIDQTANYNQNINEDMYIEEISAFIQAIHTPTAFPNTLKKDIQILKVLQILEKELGNEVLS